MAGLEANLTAARLVEGDRDALASWAAWVRDALAAGLGLLSIHSPGSLDFDLDEQEEMGHGRSIESAIGYILDTQKANQTLIAS